MKKVKRIRVPKAKPGQIIAFWNEEEKDFGWAWGAGGANKADGNLIGYYLFMHQSYINYDKTLVKELEDRGYDMTTLKFSIQKKKTEEV